MSYIVRSGNLTSVPVLRTNESGSVCCFARVAVNDRAKDEEGRWQTVGTSFYDLRVSGDTAKRLVALAEDSGNVKVVFAGRYRVTEYQRKDGGTGMSHKVYVDEIGVSLRGQTIQVTPNQTSEPTPLAPDEDEEWRSYASF